ncbi:MAG: hypothetical protein QOE67_150, partial [Solirubrobacteraceae bacterium]|nr:hypothetical protein [Solirubrobacteraceae bacterium]
GEATWTQKKPFAEISITAVESQASERVAS